MHLDNADLIEYIYRVTMGLAETLILVDSIRDRSTENRHPDLFGLAARGVLTLTS
jgi:hypothetical protein